MLNESLYYLSKLSLLRHSNAGIEHVTCLRACPEHFSCGEKRRVKAEAVRGKDFEALNFPNGVI